MYPDLFSRRFREGISFPNFLEMSILKLPLSKLCAVPLALQNRALFERERERERDKGEKVPWEGEEEGWPAKEAKRKKGKKDAWKRVSLVLRILPWEFEGIGKGPRTIAIIFRGPEQLRSWPPLLGASDMKLPPEKLTKTISSVQTRCIVKGEAQKSPLFWRFSGGFWFSQDRLFSRNSTRNPLNLIKNPRFLQTPLVNPLVFTMHLVCTLLRQLNQSPF